MQLSIIEQAARRIAGMAGSIQGSNGRAAPVRHALSRKAGWRMPENTIKVSRPSKWGNPFPVGPDRTQAEAVAVFRTWLTVEGETPDLQERKTWVLEHLEELKGKNLACWCRPGTPCHADVLLELAERFDRLPSSVRGSGGEATQLNREGDK